MDTKTYKYTTTHQFEIKDLEKLSTKELDDMLEGTKTLMKQMDKEDLNTLNEEFNQIMDYVKSFKYERPKFHNGVDDKTLEECAKYYDQLSDKEKAEAEDLLVQLKKELGIEE